MQNDIVEGSAWETLKQKAKEKLKKFKDMTDRANDKLKTLRKKKKVVGDSNDISNIKLRF